MTYSPCSFVRHHYGHLNRWVGRKKLLSWAFRKAVDPNSRRAKTESVGFLPRVVKGAEGQINGVVRGVGIPASATENGKAVIGYRGREFTHVAKHVIKSKGVRRLPADSMCGQHGVALAP